MTHTPKAVTYHEQPDYCRFMIGHSLGRMETTSLKENVGGRKVHTPKAVTYHEQPDYCRFIGHSLGRVEP